MVEKTRIYKAGNDNSPKTKGKKLSGQIKDTTAWGSNISAAEIRKLKGMHPHRLIVNKSNGESAEKLKEEK